MSNLKVKIINGVLYTAIAKYSSIIISLIVVGILSRILPPEEFGVVAIATVIINFFSIITDLGFAPAIIQNKALTNEDYNNIYSFSFYIAIGGFIIFLLLSYPISLFYNSKDLLFISWLLSISLFFNTFSIVPNALFYKEQQFKFIAIRTFIVQLICGFLSIIAAMFGCGIYSLVINPILTSIIVYFICIKKYKLKFKIKIQFQSIKMIYRFSLFQFFFNVLNYFTRNLDKLLIGKYLGASQLGYYEKSYRLMMLPLQNITHVISPVLHPVLSEYQDDVQKLQSSYAKIIKLLALIGFPLSVYLYFTANELVLLIFGNNWINSVEPFMILAFTVGIQIIMSTSGSIFQSANKTRLMFVSGVLTSMCTVIGLMISLIIYETIVYVSLSIAITFFINFFITYFLLYKYVFKKSLTSFLKLLIKPIIISFVLIFINIAIEKVIIDSNLISFIVKSIINLFGYIIILLIIKEPIIHSFIKKGYEMVR